VTYSDSLFIPAGRKLLSSERMLRPSGRRGEFDPVAGRYVGAAVPTEARPSESEAHIEAEVEEHPWRKWTGPPQ
jgi:hypothetical protein